MLREDAIEDVIRQFADPMAFLRELVQNALDAGTGEVEIATRFEEDLGCGVFAVSDWGGGMTREIIESRLVRLFNSTKDGDYTKIGKFGIGFVSVFALNPTVVCVDTGRDGEYWRLLINPDRSWELYANDEPIEGTRVEVWIETTAEDFAQTVELARRRTHQWCRFAPASVWFDGDELNEPFHLEGLITVPWDDGDKSRAVVALRHKTAGTAELFNGGLALTKTTSQYDHISYMLDSRYLAHTLTRDEILENTDYHDLFERFRGFIQGEFANAIADALARWPADPDRTWDWEQLVSIAPRAVGPQVLTQMKFPAIGRDSQSVDEVIGARRRNQLLISYGRSHLAALVPDGWLILDIRPASAAHRALRSLIDGDVAVLEDVYVQPPPIDLQEVPGATRLLEEVEHALRRQGSRPNHVGFARFTYPYSGLDRHEVLRTPDRRTVQHRGDVKPFSLGDIDDDLLLNAEHPVVRAALEVAATEPEWAAYILVKCAALGVDAVEDGLLDQWLDIKLALSMLDRRARRTPT